MWPQYMEAFYNISMKAGSFICHQIPDRSFFLGTNQLPLCSRCTGIYGALFTGFILQMLFGVIIKDRRLTWYLASLVLLLPMGIDVLLIYMGMHTGNNVVRCLTGLLSGLGISVLLYQPVKNIQTWGVFHENYKENRPVLFSGRYCSSVNNHPWLYNNR